ncbi:MAG TPA: malto-oligosyltrehalose trehalohydrolase [Terriglobales bacterium]|jgi:maltooligosyltrehalose trehalohydrolase|nr:malto-oligosyltrehalose trehalohydrolase [Terriglobales bacterium]
MKRRHKMPFGAEYLDDGSVRFRLWAPAAQKVELCLGDMARATYIPLARLEEGWFELVTDTAKPGTQYRFRIDEGQKVPDPGSRFQPRDVHGPSEVIDPETFAWQDDSWLGRRWEEAVIYEMHVGTFTPDGTFAAAREGLDYLAELGITAIELMPVSDFPGKRNWGYDGVLPFAPDSTYGRPEDLKELVQSAHARGIMVLLDVVYNHFGPEGNYLGCYAPQFFTDRHHTPWGNAINFDGSKSTVVRDFFIQNALYWLTEYRFDGLRLDAVHAIIDDTKPDILTELADAVRSSMPANRHIHLILENERNQACYLRRNKLCMPAMYTAQWDDDIHHALHVILTGESDGYYSDYIERPLDLLGRCLTSGFAYQGELSQYSGTVRGESTRGLPPGAFVSFLQNHDQVGNRAFGERITAIAEADRVRAAVEILLLAPSTPLLFMGEEFGSETPFLFFCDFGEDLAEAVTQGRRDEFARFAKFSDPSEREEIPDPNAQATFEASRLNWESLPRPSHQQWFNLYQRLLGLRRDHIIPRLSAGCRIKASYQMQSTHGLSTKWKLGDGSTLTLLANLGSDLLSGFTTPVASPIYASEGVSEEMLTHGSLPAWSVAWYSES